MLLAAQMVGGHFGGEGGDVLDMLTTRGTRKVGAVKGEGRKREKGEIERGARKGSEKRSHSEERRAERDEME